MASRTALNAVLVSILGSPSVYFQPPENIKLVYPCIIYRREDIKTQRASNVLYMADTRYSVTVIGHDPDSSIPADILKLEKASYDRHFVKDGLNHDILSLYY